MRQEYDGNLKSLGDSGAFGWEVDTHTSASLWKKAYCKITTYNGG